MTKINSKEALADTVDQLCSNRRGFLKSLIACSAAFRALPLFTSEALSGGTGQDAPAKKAKSFEANSEITAINKTNGVVTAKLNSSGQLFQFTLINNTQLEQLKLGQPVFANVGARQIFLDGGHLAGRITNGPSPAKGKAAKGLPTQKGSPLWNKSIITSIDNTTGIITAKDNATGQSFQFRVANPGILGQLHLGQSIFANFSGRQVSFDGKAALGAITKGPQ